MLDTNVIFSDKQYKEYCKSVSNYSSQWEDLYQEFALVLLTKHHSVQTSVESYCKGIIYKIWRSYNGSETSRKKRGDHMLLANYADRAVEVGDIVETVDLDTTDVSNEINKLLNHQNPRVKLKAEITTEFLNGTNRLKISKARDINYRTAHDAVSHTIETIKTNMNKTEIKESLLAQGINSSYSGNTKTFYTDKTPSKELEEKIVKAGFKQCKK